MAFTRRRTAGMAAVAAATALAAPVTAGAFEPTVSLNPNVYRLGRGSAIEWASVKCNLTERAVFAVVVEQDQNGSTVAASDVGDGGMGPGGLFWCLGFKQPAPVLLSTALNDPPGGPTYGRLQAGPATATVTLGLQTPFGNETQHTYGPFDVTVH
jgi:hypothetical protein